MYGTLRPALTPPALATRLAKARCLGPAWVRGRLVDLGAYPGAVLDASSPSEIVGDLLEIGDAALLRTLDAYEGFDPARPEESLYLRVAAVARQPDGKAHACQLYVYARDVEGLPLVPGGDWAAARP